jgi:hypothetical protein
MITWAALSACGNRRGASPKALDGASDATVTAAA